MTMIKVLIVDDEKPARELIRSIIDWQELGFEICGEAKNGREALELYYMFEPDIIITDIQMPIMNGLDLIKEIRETDADQRFIVLSCYEDFSYAREAFLMNVEDYLIKDLLKKEELIQLLLSIADSKEKASKIFLEDGANYLIQNNKGLIDYIAKHGSREVRDSVRLEANNTYRIIIISLDDYYKNTLSGEEYDREKIKNNLIQTLESFNSRLSQNIINTFAYIGNGRAVAIIRIMNSINESIKLKSTFSIISKFRANYYERDQGHTLTISISRDFNNLDGFMERYQEAYRALRYRLFLGKNKNIIYNISIPRLTQMSEQALAIKIEKIKSAVEESATNEMKHHIQSIYKENLKGFMQYNFLKEVNGQLFYLISDLCNRNNIIYRELLGYNYLPVNMVDELDTVDEITGWFEACFERIIEMKREKSKYSRHIKDAILYIKENYDQPISLNEISETLNIHKVYLSRIFKEETGVTISSYILNIRIMIAKKLIESTNMKIYEIAEQTGFKNAQHFVVSFKKVEGITPKDYREKREK